MSRYINSVPQLQDSNGKPIVGGKKYFYEPGTTTLKTVYSDSDFSTPIANPVLSLSGGYYPDIFLDGVYKEVQEDDNSVVLWTRDPVGEIDAGQFDDWLNDKSYSFNDIVKGSDLAFYKSLVAGIETNQGNDPISSPTEWVDATFATIDGTETLTNKTLTSPVINTATINTATINNPVINTPTINGLSGLGMEILPQPSLILGDITPPTTATQVDNATLGSIGAVAAILSVNLNNNAATTLYFKSSTFTADAKYAKVQIPANGATQTEFTIDLDSNSDFWWFSSDGSISGALQIYLIGYYV